jgi:hypothetical protein
MMAGIWPARCGKESHARILLRMALSVTAAHHGRLYRRTPAVSILLLITLMLSACMPEAMQVDRTSHPRFRDENVRFRTTYYFRVYDRCLQPDGATVRITHSLYRFRMTGKAHSLTNAVHFESGTLDRSEIDPFGSTVVYDENAHAFTRVSAGDIRERYQRDQKISDTRRLLDLRTSVLQQAEKATDETEKTQLRAFATRLTSMADSLWPQTSGETAASQTKDGTSADTATSGAGARTAPSCDQMRRGFQLLGPGGVMEFDQDSRLVMAMSSSGRPLIGTLQELSGRILNSEASPGEIALPLARETGKATFAQLELTRIDAADPDAVARALRRAITALGGASEGTSDAQQK